MLPARVIPVIFSVTLLPVIILAIVIIPFTDMRPVKIIPVVVTPPVNVPLGIAIIITTILIPPDCKSRS
jgi:hypothetical protein